MEKRVNLLLGLIIFVPIPGDGYKCVVSSYCKILMWAPWSPCSSGCGQGLRYRLPGMCCPSTVTAETIFEECAVKLCNMTESDYRQAEVCRESQNCTQANKEINPLSPFGVVPVMVGSALLLATVVSGVVCVMFCAKRYKRKKEKKAAKNTVRPINPDHIVRHL